MAALTVIDAGRAGRTCTFRASSRSGVWQVTRDHVFYGDYLTREDALRSACDAARTFDAAGGTARVVAPPGESVVLHTQQPRP
ncbi:hypothetical protein [Phenylobacterium sp.]|jgi:hypothetical protein|uniref:hypothetical protein n=1 Tax=Phenylobacterium sp. TaxID=1871053 RepID=UPI002F92C2DF